MTRKKIRENVFTLLFRLDFYDRQDLDEQIELFFEDIPNAQEEEKKLIRDSFFGVLDKQEEIDEKIAACADGWKLKRIAKADLTIMRLAVYEMCFDENVPEKVAINEAVELAKLYGGDKTPGFVNAILAKVSQLAGE